MVNYKCYTCRAQTETSRNYLHCCDVCLCKYKQPGNGYPANI